MTHQEKGDELVEKFQVQVSRNGHRKTNATQCAIICVEEIVPIVDKLEKELLRTNDGVYIEDSKSFWNEVLNYLKSKP